MFKKKIFQVEIIILAIIILNNYFRIDSLIKILPNDLIKEEIIFTLYRNSIIKDDMFYLLIPILIYMYLLILNKHFNTYSIIRYKNIEYIFKNLVKDVSLINLVFFGTINILFIVNIIFKFNISYVNNLFLIYIIVLTIVEIIGCLIIFLFIVLLNLTINRIIISSFVIFGVITLLEAIIKMLKSNIKTFSRILFFRTNFAGYTNSIFMHISYIICFSIIAIFIYLVITNKSYKKDIIYYEK